MANQGDYSGSIAQNFISFATTYQVNANPGQNFNNVVLFVGSGEAVANTSTLGNYFVASGAAPAVGSLYTVNGQNYTQTVGGPLLVWLTEFFSGNNNLSNVYIAIYDDSATVGGTVFPSSSVTALTTQYQAYKMYGFFKYITNGTAGIPNNTAAQLALASLCEADNTLLSQHWVDSNDANLLVAASGTIAYKLKSSGYDSVVNYSANTVTCGTGVCAVSPSLIQLGLSLGYINSTGTAVGNSLDMLATPITGPSGSGNTSITSTQMATLASINVGYFLYIGNTTGQVALRNGKTCLGNIPAAQWVTSYIDYMSAVSAASYLAQYNRFKNNTTYQAILSILMGYLSAFVSTGRLTGASITAPSWSTVSSLSNGQTITIPNAWSATFNDNVRNVTVNGTLFISVS
jgi:hypothetical protein